MLNPVVYMTSVQVAAEQEVLWNEFYDEWVDVFTREVPGTVRGSRWQVYDGRLAGQDPLPSSSRPMYLAFEEYRRVDEFILSRSWRKQEHWEHRVNSFGPWFKHLSDYATLNLQGIGPGSYAKELGRHLLCRIWTIPPEQLEAFEQWRLETIVPMISRGAPGATEQRYVALLAQLHRHGGAPGELVIPQRHHFEDGGRLCYVDLYELPGDDVAPEFLDELQSATDSWGELVADRQDVLARRLLLVERDGVE